MDVWPLELTLHLSAFQPGSSLARGLLYSPAEEDDMRHRILVWKENFIRRALIGLSIGLAR